MGIRTTLISFGAAAVAVLPLTALAATTDFFGPIIPQSGKCFCDTAMDWGCVLIVFQAVMNVLVSLGVLAVVFFIAWAGFLMITGGSNPANRTKAKNRMLNAVIGLVVILGAYIIVDTVMKVLYNPNTALEAGTFGPWNAIFAGDESNYCLDKNDHPGLLTNGSFVDTVGEIIQPGTSNSSSGPTAGGLCKVPTNSNNPCSTQNLQGTCFANQPRATEVCMLESAGGKQGILSGSDKLNSGSGPSYSVGLWQINLTTTRGLIVDGKDCRTAFSEPCTGAAIRVGKLGACRAHVVDQSLYTKCVAAAQDGKTNSKLACSLYTKTMSAWKCSASRCQVPGASTMSGKCAP